MTHPAALHMLMCALCIGTSNVRAQCGADGKKVDRVESFIAAEDPRALEAASRALLASATSQQLSDLERNSHPGVALAAAWERVRRSVSGTPTPPGEEPEPEILDKLAVQRFLGFVEGRLKATIPKKWKTTLARGWATDQDHQTFPTRDCWTYHKTYWAMAPEDTWAAAKSDPVTLLKTGDVSISRGKTTVELSEAVLDRVTENREAPYGVSVCIGDERWVIALHSFGPFTYPIACIDRNSGKLLWTSDVWCRYTRAFSGVDHHAVAVTMCNGAVYVFGSAGSSMYIEAFRLEDGENIWRFSTAY